MKTFLHAKIHGALVTEAKLEYVGSITIDEDFMDAVGIQEFEKVLVTSFTSGNRLETYVIKGERGSLKICLNGPASHLIKKGEYVVIMAFELVDVPPKQQMILLEDGNRKFRHLPIL